MALDFEAAGCQVIVAENGPMGRDWLGDHWYTLTLAAPGCAGGFDCGDASRWDSFGQDICEWRKGGREVIIIGQRGIGPPGIAMPAGWDLAQFQNYKAAGYPVRMREHPGEKRSKPLEEDLADAAQVVTWSSSVGIKALLWGIPVRHGLHAWIGRQASLRVGPRAPAELVPWRDPRRMFLALGWTMWRTREIETGEPFRRLAALPLLRLRDIPDLS